MEPPLTSHVDDSKVRSAVMLHIKDRLFDHLKDPAESDKKSFKKTTTAHQIKVQISRHRRFMLIL